MKKLFTVTHLTENEVVRVNVITTTLDDAAMIVGRILDVDGWNLHVEKVSSIDINPACSDMVCGINASSIWH